MLTTALLFALVSCGPVTYTLPVEKRSGQEMKVDLRGTLPGIVSVVMHEDSDSALLSAFAIGMAEQLELDLGLDSGAIPVYSMYVDEVNMNDSAAMAYLHAAVGVENLIMLDSMNVGEFSVTVPVEKAYSGGSFLQQTIVSLPYSLRVQIFGSSQAEPLEAMKDEQVMEWTLFSDASLNKLKALEKVNSELEQSFRSMGGTLAEEFMPQWETVNKMLYVYNDKKWTEACRLAWLFEWDKAMDIWYGEADSPNTRKAACAAHNLSVACEILGMDDLSAQWEARFRELMGK